MTPLYSIAEIRHAIEDTAANNTCEYWERLARTAESEAYWQLASRCYSQALYVCYDKRKDTYNRDIAYCLGRSESES